MPKVLWGRMKKLPCLQYLSGVLWWGFYPKHPEAANVPSRAAVLWRNILKLQAPQNEIELVNPKTVEKALSDVIWVRNSSTYSLYQNTL